MSARPGAAARRNAALADALARTALGDRSAFAALYKLGRAPLFGVISAINTDRGRAEQVLQEVFADVWQSADGFDVARSLPMTWLTAIARNRAIDSLRRRGAAAGGDGESDVIDGLASEAAAALQRLQQAAGAQPLGERLPALSREQQQCVALAFFHGLSHAEVAQRLRQPLRTVKDWTRRALVALAPPGPG